MLNIIIQGILSLFLVFIMAFIGYSVYNYEYVQKLTDMIIYSNKNAVSVFKGRFEFANKEINIETYNPNLLGYLNINPSKNQNGGAEYSYNFWLYYHLDSNTNKINRSNSIKDYIILFFKGSKNKSMNYKINNYECPEDGDKKILIKNPLVKLRNDGKEILVEYNNINFPETYNYNSKPIACTLNNGPEDRDDDLYSKNKFGIKNIDTNYTNDKFSMITIVFQENPSNEDVFNNNSANYRIYLNGDLVEDRLANTNFIENVDSYDTFKSRVIKNNNSKLHINPLEYDNMIYSSSINTDYYINSITPVAILDDTITEVAPLQLADFTYFNYALSTAEIKGLYKKGFNSYLAPLNDDDKMKDIDYANKYVANPPTDLSNPI